MTRITSFIAFALGAVVVLWMGAGFIQSSPLALLVTLLIAAAYVAGFVELLRYQQATASLDAALDNSSQPVDDLSNWLANLHPSLRFAVRQRIAGEAIGLPAPVITPYLVGLLVMLGLLGTFIGMVETLQGAVGALQGSTELEAVREGLAAPIQGLGMAFATSVAGITASAMLGLISTLSRRQRLESSRRLDGEMAGLFQAHSLSHQRRETYAAMRSQAEALPQVAGQLGELAEQLNQHIGQLSEQLTQNQQRLQDDLLSRYQQLSDSVEAALQTSLRDGAKAAAESIEPAVSEVLKGLNSASLDTQQRLGDVVENHLQSLTAKVDTLSETLQQRWQAESDAQQQRQQTLLASVEQQVAAGHTSFTERLQSLGEQIATSNREWLSQQQSSEQERLNQWQQSLQHSADQLKDASTALAQQGQQQLTDAQAQLSDLAKQGETLIAQRQNQEAQWHTTLEAQIDKLTATIGERLEALNQSETQRSDAAIAGLERLQETSARQLAELGSALEAPMTRLIETASETPRAAADVIEKLRAEISNNVARDNELLAERQQTMAQLNTLSASLEENTRMQQEAVQALLDRSAQSLKSVEQQFADKVSEESASLQEQMAHFSASAAELSALGEVFTAAVTQFGDANTQLMARLESIESALQSSGQRSEEQMEYFLTQAREIIDHNLLSHQELLDKLGGVNAAQAGGR